MSRFALIETMARAISDAQGFPADECFNIGHQKFPNETMANWENYTDEAAAALSALEAMAAIVPREATDQMARAVLNTGYVEWERSGGVGSDKARIIHATMIAASPFAKETTDE